MRRAKCSNRQAERLHSKTCPWQHWSYVMSSDIAQSPARPWNDPARLTVMFVAAFLATLIFHQGMFAILHSAGLIPAPPFPMAPTEPFGLPTVFSLAFWGGVWCFVFPWQIATAWVRA